MIEGGVGIKHYASVVRLAHHVGRTWGIKRRPDWEDMIGEGLLALAACPDREDAELSRKSACRIAAAIRRWLHGEPDRSWRMIRIPVVNQMRDSLKAQKEGRHAPWPSAVLAEQMPETSPTELTTEDEALGDMGRDFLLEHALDAIPISRKKSRERARQVLLLHIQGYRGLEIAEKLGIKKSWVSALLMMVRQGVRRAQAEMNGDLGGGDY